MAKAYVLEGLNALQAESVKRAAGSVVGEVP
jgi:hypothetical protein